MWRPFVHFDPWDVAASCAGSLLNAKEHYELRVLGFVLPALLDAPPARIIKRESPDFEVVTTQGAMLVELVDAVPNAVSDSGTMNLAKRRSRPSSDFYHVEAVQFGAVIATQIEAKKAKARDWLQRDPAFQGRLILGVNVGQGPLSITEYLRSADQTAQLVQLNTIEPFQAVVLADGSGAYVWRA